MTLGAVLLGSITFESDDPRGVIGMVEDVMYIELSAGVGDDISLCTSTVFLHHAHKRLAQSGGAMNAS